MSIPGLRRRRHRAFRLRIMINNFLIKKAYLLLLILAMSSVAVADTQDYVKGNVILIKSRIAYFDLGQNDDITPGQSFEIYSDRQMLTSGKIGWVDKDISKSLPLDSNVVAPLQSKKGLIVKIRLYVSGPRRGGFLNIAYFSDLHLDPSSIVTSDERMVGRLIHRGLITRDNSGNFVPDLCSDFEIRDLTYTFYLNDSNKFQSGQPLTSGDVIYSFEQLAKAERLTSSSCFIMEIEGAEAYRHGIKNEIDGIFLIDDSTLSITLKRQFPAFEDYLAGPGGYIIPRPGVAPFGEDVIGAGPYRIKWHDDNGIALEPSESSSGTATLDSVRFLRYQSVDEAGLALELGRLDLIALMGEPQPKFVSRGKYSIQNYQALSYVVLGINGKRESQSAQILGKAFSFLLNRDAIIRVILGGSGAIPTYQVTNQEINLALPSMSDSADFYLDSLGRKPANLTLYVDSVFPVLSKVARFIEGQLQNKGIKITEKNADFLSLDESQIDSDLDLYLTCYLPVSGSPDCVLYPLLSDSLSGQSNFLFTNDEALQTFLDNLHIETDSARRDNLASGLAQSVAADPPLVFLYQPMLTTISKATIKGVSVDSTGFIDLRGASMEAAR
jgi:ABC-type transport system substrate-binding protein